MLHIRKNLGVENCGSSVTRQKMITVFDEIGRALRADLGPGRSVDGAIPIHWTQLTHSTVSDQRERLVAHMDFFLRQSSEEQAFIKSRELLSFESYWKMRMGTSAIDVTTCMLEYAYDLHISEEIVTSPAMLKLFRSTNEIISLYVKACQQC
jgi:hypothetical protein